MDVRAIGPTGQAPGTEAKNRVKAAHDFESLLVAQMLKTLREGGSGWLGTGDDQAADSAFGLAEEELAKSLVAGGGLGLAKQIEQGLRHTPSKAKPVG